MAGSSIVGGKGYALSSGRERMAATSFLHWGTREESRAYSSFVWALAPPMPRAHSVGTPVCVTKALSEQPPVETKETGP